MLWSGEVEAQTFNPIKKLWLDLKKSVLGLTFKAFYENIKDNGGNDG